MRRKFPCKDSIVLKDYGSAPLVIGIGGAAKQNNTYRTVLWTGEHLQLVVMSIGVCGDIGLEVHPDTDQFIRIEQGKGLVMTGSRKDAVACAGKVCAGDAVVIPAGTWHNLINAGDCPIKLYTLYAPPEHPKGTVHITKADAAALENAAVHRAGSSNAASGPEGRKNTPVSAAGNAHAAEYGYKKERA